MGQAALGTCFGLMLIGLIVLVGWHTHVPAAIHGFPGLIPMQYNTALLSRVGSGRCGFLNGPTAVAVGCGELRWAHGRGGNSGIRTGISFGVDTLFSYPWERTLSADPGRMALTTGISFFLTGSALVILFVRQGAYGVNSIPLSLALTSLIGYSLKRERLRARPSRKRFVGETGCPHERDQHGGLLH